MEKQGVKPDVAIDITPQDWAKGLDSQLTKAVDVVSGDVVAWKKGKATTSAPPAKIELTSTEPPAAPPAIIPTATPAPVSRRIEMIPRAAE